MQGATFSTLWEFQSTLPREERQYEVVGHGLYGDFNPRSRERSDLQTNHRAGAVGISIHAPARGATAA